MRLPFDALAGRREGDLGAVPVFTVFRSVGAAPSFSPVASPWVRRRLSPRASVPASLSGIEVADHVQRWSARTTARPVSTRFEPVPRLRGFNHWFTLVTPIHLASRARTVWQCQPAPSLSRLLPALPRISGVRLPPASPDCCDSPAEGPYTPPEHTAPHGALAPHGSDRRPVSRGVDVLLRRPGRPRTCRSRRSGRHRATVGFWRPARSRHRCWSGLRLALVGPVALSGQRIRCASGRSPAPPPRSRDRPRNVAGPAGSHRFPAPPPAQVRREGFPSRGQGKPRGLPARTGPCPGRSGTPSGPGPPRVPPLPEAGWSPACERESGVSTR